MLGFFLGIGILLYLAFRLSLVLVPIIIAYVLSLLMEPLVGLLNKKARIPRKLAAGISLLLVVSTAGFLLALLATKLFAEILLVSQYLPKYFTDIYNNVNSSMAGMTDFYSFLPPELTGNLQGVFTSVLKTVADLLTSFVKGIVNTAISLPEALIFTLITIISTFFFSADKERIGDYFRQHIPDSWTDRVTSIRKDLFFALFGYVRAQLIMMSITFTELLIGFSIIGVKYALLLAVVISIIDALPILGTGGVLIPWAIYSFMTSNTRIGISLIVLYLIVLAVRQMVEPKVLSDQIGLHPLVTLSAVYAGLQLFGVGGMILGPISILIIRNIFTSLVKSSSIKEFLSAIRMPNHMDKE